MAKNTKEKAQYIQCLTPVARVNYAYIAECDTDPKYGGNKFHLTMAFPKELKEERELKLFGEMNAAVDNSIAAMLKGEWKDLVTDPSEIERPIRDGDTKKGEFYALRWFINPRTKHPYVKVGYEPKEKEMVHRVYGKMDAETKKRPQLDPSVIYNGCYVRAALTTIPYVIGNNKIFGITFALGDLQFVADGERIINLRGGAAFGDSDDEPSWLKEVSMADADDTTPNF